MRIQCQDRCQSKVLFLSFFYNKQTNPIFKIISLLVQIKCNILNVSFISTILCGVKLESYQNVVRIADHDTVVIS
jgi:hypothetical protein